MSISTPETVLLSKKLAVLSHVLPPTPSGQAIVLYRILQGFNPDSYCLLSRNEHKQDNPTEDKSHHLNARFYQISNGGKQKTNQTSSKLSNHFISLSKFRNLTALILKLYQIIKIERCDALVACSGDLYDMPIGFLASRLARIPFYAYVFDDYVYQWTGFNRYAARIMASVIFRYSQEIIVPNEFLRDEYSIRYNIEPEVIHNPCATEYLCSGSSPPWPAQKDVIRIIYTGAVYHANFDAFHNLITAISGLERKDIQLHIYTSQPHEELKANGILNMNVFLHPHLDLAEVMNVQNHADILFLPLAFNSPIPEVIRTSAPGKLGEYLASRRPILVHAPGDTFLTWYFRTNNCGVIVEQNNAETLGKGLLHIIADSDLRFRLTKNAHLCAARDFSPQTAQKRFLSIFNQQLS
jgi:glycosyltransferase involved in cell wall biosynthesis